MRILIVGGAGMLGHQLWRHLHRDHEVWVTLRQPIDRYRRFGLFEVDRMIAGIDAADDAALATVFAQARPEAVINCVGIVKQLQQATDPLVSISINSLLPHRLAKLSAECGARLIHVSTDCVFSGAKGNYRENDFSDAEDLYGRTKYLGEVHGRCCVTLRTSIIGRELETKSGLIEWFLQQRGQAIKGFRRAIYSGFTTHELARIIETVLLRHSSISGLWHVSARAISKYDLLKLAQQAFDWSGDIIPDEAFVCDRSLDSARFRTETGYQPPTWPQMLDELARAPV
jgi:dTDP-4-dehydrorhamnose reductase